MNEIEENKNQDFIRELPNNIDLERAVLAPLLLGQERVAIHTIRQAVSHPLVFFNRNHRIIYMACLDLDDQGEHIDAGGISEWLQRLNFRDALERIRKQELILSAQDSRSMSRNQMQNIFHIDKNAPTVNPNDSAFIAIGGHGLIAGILQNTIHTSLNNSRNAKLLWDLYLKRDFIRNLSEVSNKAYQTTETFDHLVDESSNILMKMGQMSISSGIQKTDSVLESMLSQIEDAKNNKDKGVKTGYGELDEALIALRKGGLYILAARPGVGKTSFALNIVEKVIEAKIPTLFLSLEVSNEDLMKKMLSAYTSIPFRNIDAGKLYGGEETLVKETVKEMNDWPLQLMDIADLTVTQLRSHVSRCQLEDPVRLLVVDYLQLLSSANPRASEYEKISDISRNLKILAKELSIPILALSQLSREGEKGKVSEPKLSHLRGSGSIEQDADAVVFLHCESEDPKAEEREMKVIVAKNRFGPIRVGDNAVKMKFYPAKQRFIEEAEIEEDGDMIENIVEEKFKEERSEEDVFGGFSKTSSAEEKESDMI